MAEVEGRTHIGNDKSMSRGVCVAPAIMAYSSASADERRALSSRSYYVGRARDLASSPDATVQVWESARY